MPEQFTLPLPHTERLTAEDFLITGSNREAVAWIEKWPDWGSPCLTLHGPSGTGKTHLAEIWRAKSQAVDLDLNEAETPGRFYILEKADLFLGDAAREEKLFHLFNRLKEADGSLLLTALQPPAAWKIGLPDLRSRLVASPVAPLYPPDDALLAAMLFKQFRDRQIRVEAGVVDYLVPRVERSAEAIRSLVARLDQTALAAGKGLSLGLVRDFLKNASFGSL